jgi:hypothetical protein
LFPVNEYFHGPSKGVSSCLEERVVPIRRLCGHRIHALTQRTA